jgi:hypothetical protein
MRTALHEKESVRTFSKLAGTLADFGLLASLNHVARGGQKRLVRTERASELAPIGHKTPRPRLPEIELLLRT